MNLKNIPNVLSMIRICLVGVFVALFFTGHEVGALIAFLTAGATDVIDGYLARKNNWITNLGKILDPVADKLMQITVLVCLAIKSYIPVWFLIAFVIKEAATLIMSALAIKRRSFTVVSRWYGKFTVCLFYATIVISVLFGEYITGIWKDLMYVPAISFAVFSFFAYVKHYSYLKKEEIKKGSIINEMKRKDD